MRSRAARMSSIDGGSMGRTARSAELDVHAAVRSRRFGEEEVRGGEILDGEPERLEQRDVVVALTPRHFAGQHVADFTEDVSLGDLAVRERRDDVARLLERGLAAIHVET